MEYTREFVKPGWKLRLYVKVGHGAWLTLIDLRNPKKVLIPRAWEFPWHDVQRGISDAELWASVGGMTEEVKPTVSESAEKEEATA